METLNESWKMNNSWLRQKEICLLMIVYDQQYESCGENIEKRDVMYICTCITVVHIQDIRN